MAYKTNTASQIIFSLLFTAYYLANESDDQVIVVSINMDIVTEHFHVFVFIEFRIYSMETRPRL